MHRDTAEKKPTPNTPAEAPTLHIERYATWNWCIRAPRTTKSTAKNAAELLLVSDVTRHLRVACLKYCPLCQVDSQTRFNTSLRHILWSRRCPQQFPSPPSRPFPTKLFPQPLLQKIPAQPHAPRNIPLMSSRNQSGMGGLLTSIYIQTRTAPEEFYFMHRTTLLREHPTGRRTGYSESREKYQATENGPKSVTT